MGEKVLLVVVDMVGNTFLVCLDYSVSIKKELTIWCALCAVCILNTLTNTNLHSCICSIF